MTTIATDGKTMAADTQAGDPYIQPFSAEKMHKVGKELIGGAGCYGEILAFVNWYPKKHRPGASEPILEHTEMLVVSLAKITCWEHSFFPFEIPPPAAIGSGAGYAIAAMKAGATPVEAVRIAAELDPFTGGEIVEISL